MAPTSPTETSADHDPRLARSRAKMLTAATELLVETGPRAITVDAVAERSGVAKSTLYRHWSSVTELLIDVMRVNVPATTPIDPSHGFEAAFRALTNQVAATLADPEWANIIPALISLRRSMPEMAELFDADRDDKIAQIAAVLDLGVAEGRLPVGIDPHLTASLLIGPLVFATISGDDDRVFELADLVVERFLASYPGAPPAGR